MLNPLLRRGLLSLAVLSGSAVGIAAAIRELAHASDRHEPAAPRVRRAPISIWPGNPTS